MAESPPIPENIREIAKIGSVHVNLHFSFNGDEVVKWKSGATIDADGSGVNPDNDPDFQSDTYLHVDGKALDADAEPYIVVPPILAIKTSNIMFGSLAMVFNTKTRHWCFAVVGDLGPPNHIGEISPACAVLVDVPENARHGGVEESILEYSIFVGIPAVVGDKKYVLQKYK